MQQNRPTSATYTILPEKKKKKNHYLVLGKAKTNIMSLFQRLFVWYLIHKQTAFQVCHDLIENFLFLNVFSCFTKANGAQ